MVFLWYAVVFLTLSHCVVSYCVMGAAIAALSYSVDRSGSSWFFHGLLWPVFVAIYLVILVAYLAYSGLRRVFSAVLESVDASSN